MNTCTSLRNVRGCTLVVGAGAEPAENERDSGDEVGREREIGGGRGVGLSCSAGWREKCREALSRFILPPPLSLEEEG